MSEPSREVVERAARALHADWDTYPNVVFQDDVRRDIRIVLEASGLIEERDALRLVIEIPDDHPWAQHHVAAADIIIGIRRAIEHEFWDLPPLRYSDEVAASYDRREPK